MLTLEINPNGELKDLILKDDNSPDEIEIPDCNNQDIQRLMNNLADMLELLEHVTYYD